MRQAKVPKKKLNVASDCRGNQEKGGQVSILCDELVSKLEEVDQMIREEIRREVISNGNNNGLASSRLACLMRSRADVQSAITCLLGASH
jgi:DNA polymerase II small subunit/DNA polymerase delta subunit B